MKFIAALFLLVLIGYTSSSQTRVILDTDMDSDVDDVAALAMLHRLVADRQVELTGVIVTSNDPYAPLCADAINAYFGNGNIPIGFLKGQQVLSNNSRYTKQISETFPHRLKSFKDAREAATLYRELLSKGADGSMVIVTIGHLSSFQALLQSGPDKLSPLSGLELAQKKVSRWICMGGMFPEGKEANFYRPDPQSTIYCLKAWKNPVVFCGWEVGKEIMSGGQELQKELPAESPVYKAFELYNSFEGRPSWDQTAILLLTKEYLRFFEIERNGYCLIEPEGSNRWIFGFQSNHSYLAFKQGAEKKEIVTVIDKMLKK